MHEVRLAFLQVSLAMDRTVRGTGSGRIAKVGVFRIHLGGGVSPPPPLPRLLGSNCRIIKETPPEPRRLGCVGLGTLTTVPL